MHNTPHTIKAKLKISHNRKGKGLGYGCQVYRNPETSKKAAMELKSKYGRYAKVFFNQTHGQWEVQPQWSKLRKFYEIKYGLL